MGNNLQIVKTLFQYYVEHYQEDKDKINILVCVSTEWSRGLRETDFALPVEEQSCYFWAFCKSDKVTLSKKLRVWVAKWHQSITASSRWAHISRRKPALLTVYELVGRFSCPPGYLCGAVDPAAVRVPEERLCNRCVLQSDFRYFWDLLSSWGCLQTCSGRMWWCALLQDNLFCKCCCSLIFLCAFRVYFLWYCFLWCFFFLNLYLSI